MAQLEVSNRAPEFSATTQDGKTISLSDYVGKRGLVIFFYPKDGTPPAVQRICRTPVCADFVKLPFE